MTFQAVNLLVTASIPMDCDFWPEGDEWKGVCQSLSVTVSPRIRKRGFLVTRRFESESSASSPKRSGGWSR